MHTLQKPEVATECTTTRLARWSLVYQRTHVYCCSRGATYCVEKNIVVLHSLGYSCFGLWYKVLGEVLVLNFSGILKGFKI